MGRPRSIGSVLGLTLLCALAQARITPTESRSATSLDPAPDPRLGPPVSAWYLSLKTSKGYCGLVPATAGGFGYAIACNNKLPQYDVQFTLLLPPVTAAAAQVGATRDPGESTGGAADVAPGGGVPVADAAESGPAGAAAGAAAAEEIAGAAAGAAAAEETAVAAGPAPKRLPGRLWDPTAPVIVTSGSLVRLLMRNAGVCNTPPQIPSPPVPPPDVPPSSPPQAETPPPSGPASRGVLRRRRTLALWRSQVAGESAGRQQRERRGAGTYGSRAAAVALAGRTAAAVAAAAVAAGRGATWTLRATTAAACRGAFKVLGCEDVAAAVAVAADGGGGWCSWWRRSCTSRWAGGASGGGGSDGSGLLAALEAVGGQLGDLPPRPVICSQEQPSELSFRIFKSDLKEGQDVDLDKDWIYLMEGDKFCTLADVAGLSAVVSCHLDAPGWSGYKFQLQTMSYPRAQLLSLLTGGPCGVRLPELPGPHDMECQPGEQAGRTPEVELLLQTPGSALTAGVVVGMSTFSPGLLGTQQQRCCAAPSSPHILLCQPPSSGQVPGECWFQLYDVKISTAPAALPDAAATDYKPFDGLSPGGALPEALRSDSGGAGGGDSSNSGGAGGERGGFWRAFLRALQMELSPAGLDPDLNFRLEPDPRTDPGLSSMGSRPRLQYDDAAGGALSDGAKGEGEQGRGTGDEGAGGGEGGAAAGPVAHAAVVSGRQQLGQGDGSGRSLREDGSAGDADWRPDPQPDLTRGVGVSVESLLLQQEQLLQQELVKQQERLQEVKGRAGSGERGAAWTAAAAPADGPDGDHTVGGGGGSATAIAGESASGSRAAVTVVPSSLRQRFCRFWGTRLFTASHDGCRGGKGAVHTDPAVAARRDDGGGGDVVVVVAVGGAGGAITDGSLVMLTSKAFGRYCSVSVDGTLLCVSAQASNASRNLFTLVMPPPPAAAAAASYGGEHGEEQR